jgi:hypothetical protein
MEPRAEAQIRSLVRTRWVLLGLMVLVPAGCHGLFERQARRLDALSEHPARTPGTITRIERQGGAAYATYEYAFGATRGSWTVSREDAPGEVGAPLEVLVLPEEPDFSRPATARLGPAEEAAGNRRFTRWAVLGAAYFFFAILALAELNLRKARRGVTELTDPTAYRQRLVVTAGLLAPVLLGITAWHWQDAAGKGESGWPVLLGLGLAVGVLGGTFAYAAKDGPAQASARSARVLRWAAPLATGLALVRLLAWWLSP